MLDLEVGPGRSLGSEQWEFTLGMPLMQAITILRRQCRIVKEVNVLYCDQDPLSLDLVLNLPQDGIKLRFDSRVQRLKIIEVCDLSKVKLKYCGNHFSSSSVQPTIEKVYATFGATHPGIYDPTNSLFTINFRGLSFHFPVPQQIKFETSAIHGLSSLPIPKNGSIHVSKIFIFSGSTWNEARPPPLPPCSFYGNTFCENVTAVVENGLTVGLELQLLVEASGFGKGMDSRKNDVNRVVRFGESCQDVMTALGCPSKIFYKSEDKMRIHSRRFQRDQRRSSDYFFNYFTLGLDILFDAITHRAKKFILHSNYPGHYHFNIYCRCDFKIPIPNCCNTTEGDKLTEPDTPFITPFTKWNEIQPYLVPLKKPVVLNRASTINTTNPFGSTFCYGVENMIVEVMSNNHIASVTIYTPRPANSNPDLLS
ncbi:phagosome assembly factor 1-like [Antedon mediterranea]|uniref:phagosome assembly factor 1-like n=1 Tax=Antedon mediterranea TaxID=105859 RepID=UPI003AF4643E